jgi:hypothetical protein
MACQLHQGKLPATLMSLAPSTCSASRAGAPNPETPKTPISQEPIAILSTTAKAHTFLLSQGLLDKKEDKVSAPLLLKLLSNIAHCEDVPAIVTAHVQAIMLLFYKTLKPYDKALLCYKDLLDKLDQHLDQDNPVGVVGDQLQALSGRFEVWNECIDTVEAATLETQKQVVALCKQFHMVSTQWDNPDDAFDLPSVLSHPTPPALALALAPAPFAFPSERALEEVDTRVTLQARCVLVEPSVDKEGLQGLSEEVLVKKAALALEKAWEADPDGLEAVIQAAKKLAHGGVCYTLNSSAAASWLCSTEVANVFETALGDVSFYGQEPQILVEMVPIHLDLDKPQVLCKIKEKNELGLSAIVNAEWIKPKHRCDSNQKFTHAKFTLHTNSIVDHVIC